MHIILHIQKIWMQRGSNMTLPWGLDRDIKANSDMPSLPTSTLPLGSKEIKYSVQHGIHELSK